MKKYLSAFVIAFSLFGITAAGSSAFADTAAPAIVVSNFQFTNPLTLGMSSSDVKQLQMVLNKNAATAVAAAGSIGSAGNESTYFGQATLHAVEAFQKLNNIPATGYVGVLTMKALNAALGTTTASSALAPTPVAVTAVVTTTSPINAGTMAETLTGRLTQGTIASDNVTGLSFEYGPGSFAAFPSTATVALPADTTTNMFSTTLTGLLPGTNYSYEACATTAANTACGESYTFTTPALIAGACAITSFSSNLPQIVKGGNAVLSWTTSGCSAVELTGAAMNQAVSQNSSMSVGPMNTGAVYTLTASSAADTTAQTLIVPLSGTVALAGVHAPTITNITVAPAAANTALISMAYDGGGEVPSVWFAYGTSPTAVTATSSLVSGDTFGGTAKITLSSLSAGDYYVQAFVKNSAGTAGSPIVKVTIPNS